MPKLSNPRRWAAIVSAVALAAGAAAMLTAPPAASAAARAHTALPPAPQAAQHPYKHSCATPTRAGIASCMALVRTNVTPVHGVLRAGVTAQTTPSGYGPADLQSAYNLPSSTAGNGATVALIDAYNDPAIASDLATYRAQYGLPPCTEDTGCFQVVNQNGQASPLPPDANTAGPYSVGWDSEESLDVEMVSAVCPNCKIILVEATDSTIDNLGLAEDTAVKLGADYVSNSYGANEGSGETSFDQYYDHPGIVITASGGDGGYGVNYPSASPYVTAVGGTSLTQDISAARGWDETVWNDLSQKYGATGSGCSQVEPQPSWQAGVTQDCTMRATTDVSADADPLTGVAVYDTWDGTGWNVYGGTSVASPIVASAYALAGLPAAGTYPASYPYHDTSQSSDLFDITSGNDGTCTGVEPLCTAGSGWDGPTGLGTPHGVKALQGAPMGQVTGTVTDAATGQPVAGATVSVPGLSVTTGSDGTYTLSGLPAATYQVSASYYGDQTQTRSVTVTANQAAAQNFTLTGTPLETVSGTVTAGTGTAWPLSAQVSWTDANGHSGTTYTNPATGAYTLSLLDNTSYTLTVTAQYPSTPQGPAYQQGTATVAVATSGVTQNFALPVNLLACTAIGYHATLSGTTQAFGTTSTPSGWQVTNNDQGLPYYSSQPGWQFANPGGRANATGGSGNFAIVDSDHAGQFSYQNTDLVSPVTNLSAATTPVVQFGTDYQPAVNSTATVDVSVNGGKTWANVWTSSGFPGVQGPASIVIPLPQAVGRTQVQVRFGYTGQWSQWWEIDNVGIGQRTCTQQAGGLIVGQVTDSSGAAINGATVASTANPADSTLTAADSASGGGYDLFVAGNGSQQFTASATGYTSGTQTAAITAGKVSTLNFTLAAASL